MSTASSGHSGTRVEKHAQLHLRASQPLGGRGEDEVQEVEPAIDQRLGFGLDGLAADRAAGMELEIGGGLVGFDQQQVDAGLRQRLGRGPAIAEEPGDFLLNLGHMRLRGSASRVVEEATMLQPGRVTQ